MKRLLAILLVLQVLTLVGCASKKPITVTDWSGNEYIIDRKQGTISDGAYTYQYTCEGDADVYQITIEYPNGGTYHYEQNYGFGAASHNSLYREENYTSGDLLAEVLADNIVTEASARNILAVVILSAGGLFCIIAPKTGWHMRVGWQFRDAEPSDAAITYTRIGGGICLVVAVIMLLC